MKKRLGHYDIVSELGRGGMGVVYKGYETSLNRYVAIKVLADALAHDEGIKERFLREARSMASLNDPHIIQIYSIDEDEGRTYFVMEFVEGESLSSMLTREHALSVEQAARIIYQTALGLSSAHDRGVVHRDIKPGNLMISSRGVVKIADFGIALSSEDISRKLTSTGEFVGTPGYLSPEVCLGKPVDQRSDIFSLGIVLFEMLVGRMPFTDESPLGLMLEVVKADIPDVRELNAEVDPEIATILRRMIAKEPVDRYQSCHELAADLAVHPLVAKGGTMQLKTHMSTAAATLIGQPTPAPAKATGPITGPSPTPTPAATVLTTQPAAPAPRAATHRTTADRVTAASRAAPARRSVALPLAIAGILVLGVATSAWAFRAHIPLLNTMFNGTASTVTQNDAGSMAVQDGRKDSPRDMVAIDSSGSAASSLPDADTDGSVVVNPDSVAMADNSRVDEDSASPSSQSDASESGTRAPASSSNVAAVDDATSIDKPLAVASVAPVRQEPVQPRPRVPTIALVASGDDVISAPVQEAIGDLLRRRGFRVIDGRLGSSGPDVSGMRGKADVVLYVNARPVGSQEMTYYGQSSTLYTVQLAVKAYKVASGEVLWSSGGEQVNFTSLNAAEKAREAIEPMLDHVDASLRQFRPRGRG